MRAVARHCCARWRYSSASLLAIGITLDTGVAITVSDRLVVPIVVVAGPDSLPAPRCRLPTPARANIEANAGDKRRRGKGEEAAIMESMETSERKPIMQTSERKPIHARCKSCPEPEAAGADEPTAQSRTAEPACTTTTTTLVIIKPSLNV